MKITELFLKNYRGAESLHLELDPNLNVLIGVNGAGKSTVLDAIAIMLSWLVNRIRSAGSSGRPITESDITNGKSAASIFLTCQDHNENISWKLTKSRKGHRVEESHSKLSELNDFTKQTQTKITDYNENIDLPVLIYYPVNRAVLDIPLKIRNKHLFTLLSTYDKSLVSGINFRVFFEWFREREDSENELKKNIENPPKFLAQSIDSHQSLAENFKYLYNKDDDIPREELGEIHKVWVNIVAKLLEDILDKNDGHVELSKITDTTEESFTYIINILQKAKDRINSVNIIDSQLGVVRKALGKFLPDFTDFSIRRNPLRMEVKKDGKTLIVNQLSDGEKCLIALVGDLARRMAIANPTRGNPLEGEGIVLIDEIDLHLHPKWQRNVIPKLTEVFPNCQFIISTHSPHVINQVWPENIFLLDQTPNGIVATHPSKSYGNNADRILEDLMGLETTRPDNVFQDLRDIYELISQDDLPEATNKIATLKGKIGPDPELVKAEVLIRRKEIIGK